MLNNTSNIETPSESKKPRIFLLVLLGLVIVSLIVIIVTSSQLNINNADNSNQASFTVTEDSPDDVALATNVDTDYIDELPQTGNSCVVPTSPTPFITCSPVPTSAATKTPTPTTNPVATKTPTPVPTVALIKVSSSVYVTVMGTCSANTKGFRVQQMLLEGPTEWSVKNSGYYVTEGRSWTFGPTTNVRMDATAETPYTVFRSHLDRYPVWVTRTLVYQQYKTGSDVAISPYYYSGKITFGAADSTSTAVNIQVSCKK